ncbi:MAG TPA: ChbG/HpnK family deacetylase, partial [Thermoanaerobaculia bacterium]
MKTLVVTADDVGLHPGMTLGALRAHEQGIVTACSVVANGRALDDAIERLRDRPKLDAGVHFTFVGGERPLSP